MLDRVFEAVREGSPARLDALEILERVAMGRMDSGSSELETRVGLKPGELRGPSFSDSTVRAHALRKIGEVGLPEALIYLQNLRKEDFGQDPSQMVWPTAQIALRDAQLRRIADPYIKTQFLEGILTGMRDGRGAVASWAVDELCDRGAQMSLAVIYKSVRSRGNGLRDEEEIEFCEARIRVLLGSPDRVKALGYVLTAASDTVNTRLMGWAVNQLHSIRSPSADAELDRFAREIAGLPERSSRKLRFGIYRQEILDFQRQRAK